MLGGIEAFVVFQAEDATGCYRFSRGCRIPDEEMDEVATSALQSYVACSPSELKALPKPRRNECLMALHDAGLSIRQIGRLTGIGIRTIARVTSSRMA